MVKNRLTPELLEKLKQRRKAGDSYSKLSIEFKIPTATILYNLNKEYREKKKKSQREYERATYLNKKFTPEQKKKRNEKSASNFKERYQNDPEFRRQHIKRVNDANKRKKMEER